MDKTNQKQNVEVEQHSVQPTLDLDHMRQAERFFRVQARARQMQRQARQMLRLEERFTEQNNPQSDEH